MRAFLRFIGMIVFFCALPFWFFYFKGRERTRVLVFNGDKLLIMKSWLGDNKWHLPGGGLRRNEDAVDGAVRELKEETSLELDPRQLQDIGKGTYARYGIRFDYQVFLAKVAVVPHKVRAQRIEVAEIEWRSPAELNPRSTSHDTLRALQMARETGALLQ